MMGLINAFPAVCSVLRGKKLQSEAGIVLVRQEGPKNGANVWFHFDISDVQPRRTPIVTLSPTSPPPRLASRPLSLGNALTLISCSKMKLASAAPARELYYSPAFQKKRMLVEREKSRWLILSAKHGLVEPTDMVEPYDITLTTMGTAARRQWAEHVLTRLMPIAREVGHVIFLSGQRYCEHLIDPLVSVGVEVHEPLKGFRQGEQLAWLTAQ